MREGLMTLVRVESLRRFPVPSHAEVMTLVSGRRLWTRDKRLIAACRDVRVAYVDEP